MITMGDDGATGGVENPNPRKVQRTKDSVDRLDFISSLPDQILQHMLSFIPTRTSITTSVLSKRWRRVWYETPILDITASDSSISSTSNLIETLTHYTAPKITSCHLLLNGYDTHHITTLIKFAISHNVEKLVMSLNGNMCYNFPDSFYLSSSLVQLSLSVSVYTLYMVPGCSVSWKSLRNLSLKKCRLSDETIANILSGCPKLESLELYQCDLIKHLDLSKSLSLKSLEIASSYVAGLTKIVAPHIRYLILTNYHHEPCTLVDVSSLIEAKLGVEPNSYCGTDFLQSMVLEMLAKLQNVERLTLTGNFLQVLTLAELCGVPFPTLKVSTLIAETKILRYVIPGIRRLLQNSPGLKKLVVHTIHNCNIWDAGFEDYLDSNILNSNHNWRSTYEMFPTEKEIDPMLCCKGATSKVLASFMELVLRNAHDALETIVVQFKDTYLGEEWFEQLLQMPPTLPHRNNVSIMLNQKNYSIVASMSN